WIEAHVVLPLTRLQAGLAAGLFGAPAAPVEATLACSGTDALALCLAAILAYPVAWPARLAGAAGGVVLILGLNTLRIGTLGWLAASPAWFDAVHVYVWPGALTLGIAVYVLTWMRLADRAPDPARRRWPPQPSRRFVGLTVTFLLLFAAVSPLYAASPVLLALAGFVARAAATILAAAGVSASAAANVLWTARGGFLVTPECVATPLIPIYLAAVCAYSTTWPRMVAGAAAAFPLFVALGIARLLVVALPGVADSPTFFVHAFYQMILGALVVCLAARWRHGAGAAPGPALVGIVVGVLVVVLLTPAYAYARVVTDLGAPLDDPQGAIAFLPPFQVGLYLALGAAAFGAVGWSRFVAGLAALGLAQAAGLLGLHALAGYAGLTAHVRDVRGWAVAGPVLIFAVVVHLARARR
ncbi:MAG: hypothetical protein ABIT71_02470, partial [Vicinamibacteraceae bacterium]